MTRLQRLIFTALELGLGLVFLGAVVHHIANLDFKPLAAFALPILVIYFGFASLQFNRSKSIAKRRAGPSLRAGEHAVQATIWHLLGIVLGTSLYAVVDHLGLGGLWLLVFVVPYVLMQIGLVAFLRAVWTVAPQTLTLPRWQA